MKRIPIAKWQPDLEGLSNPGQSDAKNVYPTGGGYAPLKSLLSISVTPLVGRALGAISGLDDTDSVVVFAGDADTLYQLESGAFTDISKSGGYNVGDEERWELAQFGQRIIATNIDDPVQYFDIGTSSAFDDLDGSPPQARHIGIVRDFVVLGNTTTSPQELVWSGFNDSEGWVSGTNQSDSQTLKGGGIINGIIGGEVGFVFQERAITRMTYTGPPTYFQFDLVEDARGLAAPGAAIRIGAMIYYLAQDGFYSFDGAESLPIGNQKVDNWFAKHIQPTTDWQITCGTDAVNKLILWSFVSTDAANADFPDTLLAYNWSNQEWSYAKIDNEMIFQALTAGITLEELSAIYPVLEDVPLSLDSPTWAGGQAYLGAFDTTNQLSSFTGETLAATVQTGDFEGSPGRRSLVNNLRPHTDTSAATIMVRSRERFADTLVDTNATDMMPNGDCPVMSSGRYHQAEINIPAGTVWTFLNALDVDAQDDGEL